MTRVRRAQRRRAQVRLTGATPQRVRSKQQTLCSVPSVTRFLTVRVREDTLPPGEVELAESLERSGGAVMPRRGAFMRVRDMHLHVIPSLTVGVGVVLGHELEIAPPLDEVVRCNRGTG